MDTHFDVVLLGTGLTESIVAAALSKSGFKIAHIDENPYYGADEASLSLDELIKWVDDRSTPSSGKTPNSVYISAQRSRFTHITRSETLLSHPGQYSLSLCPALIPAVGPLISSLVSSGVARYGGYRLIEQVGVYHPSGKVMQVPGSKEDIFKNKDISLLEKRRLMRFLMFAVGDYEGSSELSGKENTPFYQFLRDAFTLNDDLAQVITYSLAFCTSSSDLTFPALQRARRYLQSAGRYGPSSFIIGHYGGAGEISQGFSRTSAVHGGVYVLGRRILSLDRGPSGVESHHLAITLDDFPDTFSCDVIVSPHDYVLPELLPSAAIMPSLERRDHAIVRCIAIIDQPISFHRTGFSRMNHPIPQPAVPPSGTPQIVDNGVLIFPPASLAGGSSRTSTTVLITGESSMSAPKGKWIVYISMPMLDADASSSPEDLLRPYLTATLSFVSVPVDVTNISPVFTVFYIDQPPRYERIVSPPNPKVVVTPSISSLLPESLDSAAVNAEAVFRKVVGILRSRTPLYQSEAKTEDEGFWPPLQEVDDEMENW